MISNPYFLPERNPANLANQLLANTVGTDTIPIDVFIIPEQMDYEVIFSSENFQDDNKYGFSDISSEDNKIIYLNAKFYGNSFEEVIQNDTKRRHCRFTLAHELGHCTIPEHSNVELQSALLNKKNSHAKKYSFHKEYEANVFASELLIPSSTITNIYSFGKTFKDIINNLSLKYDTSLIASSLKAASLMNDSICICLQINKSSGKIINLKYSNAFREYGKGLFIAKNSYPYSGSLANNILKGRMSMCNHQLCSSPQDWFPNFIGSDEAELHEWSFDMGENIITFLELIDTSMYSLYIN